MGRYWTEFISCCPGNNEALRVTCPMKHSTRLESDQSCGWLSRGRCSYLVACLSALCPEVLVDVAALLGLLLLGIMTLYMRSLNHDTWTGGQ